MRAVKESGATSGFYSLCCVKIWSWVDRCSEKLVNKAQGKKVDK